MALLGIDTSNYATSLAVVNDAEEVICAKKVFLPVKDGQCGLRQSDAVFHHTVALPTLIEEMQREGALQNICGVGVSKTPRPLQGSYMPCFLAGVGFATAFAIARQVPLIATSHQQGHVAAALYATNTPRLFAQKILVFHISGGTTELLLCEGYSVLDVLGQSLDLYAGQAVDRLGVSLGFSFPAGKQLSDLAAQCDELPSPKISVKGCDCYFSGLQNQCQQLLGQGRASSYVAKYCLVAIAKTICAMAAQARKQYPNLPLVCAGGVMSSDTIREYVTKELPNVYFVPPQYASDNAIGTALIAAKEILHKG